MIDKDLAAFLEDGARHPHRHAQRAPRAERRARWRRPSRTTATHLTVYVPTVAAARCSRTCDANGQVAVVFARPVDDRACQVKGVFVSARDARRRERALVAAQWDGFPASLEKIGMPRAGDADWVIWPCMAIRLRVTALFDQTPGPDAGAASREPDARIARHRASRGSSRRSSSRARRTASPTPPT